MPKDTKKQLKFRFYSAKDIENEFLFKLKDPHIEKIMKARTARLLADYWRAEEAGRKNKIKAKRDWQFLSRLIPPKYREGIVGDLQEDYAEMVKEERGKFQIYLVLLGQIVLIGLAIFKIRLSDFKEDEKDKKTIE